MTRHPSPRLLFLPLLLAVSCARPTVEQQPVTVFAASSLTGVLTTIAGAWEDSTGIHVRLSFAASSVLARQVQAGARADVLALASSAWMDFVSEQSLIEPGTRRRPIGNRLVLVAPLDTPLPVSDGLGALSDLPEGEWLAVGDPSHVPAGVYARESLVRVGLWDDLEPRLAPSDNARAALALVERGEAALGIVYASDALMSPRVRIVGVIPDSLHTPIVYETAIVRGRTGDAVASFADYLVGAKAADAFRRAGFAVRKAP